MRIEGAHTRSPAPRGWLAGGRWPAVVALVAALSLVIALSTGGSASAAGVTLTVPCSGTAGADLAAAVVNADAGGGGTITLTSGCNYSFGTPYANAPSQQLADWYGPAALPAIAAPITIVGNGATISRSAASGTPPFRLFFVGADPSAAATTSWATPGAGTLELENLTLSGGFARGGNGGAGGGGGGLGAGGAVYSQGTTVLLGVTLSGNAAQGGSAVTGSGADGGGGMGPAAPTNGNGSGFGAGFSAPAGAPSGGAGFATGGGGGGAGFATSGAPGAAFAAGVGGGSFTGTGGDAQSGTGALGGDGSGGGSVIVGLTAGGNGGAFGQGGLAGSAGGGGGGVGGGGASAGAGAGGGFGGGGGLPSGAGGFGGGGAGGGAPGGAGGFGAGTGAAGSGGGGGGAGMGGAVFNHHGILIVENATLSGNSATGGSRPSPNANLSQNGQGLGGAIFSLNGVAALINDTIAANTADDGGGLYMVGYDANSASTAGTAVLINNILSGSVTASGASTNDLVVYKPGTVADGTANQAGATGVASAPNIVVSTSPTGSVSGTPATADPVLAPLAFNGGPGMLTMLPQTGSAALTAGTTTNAPATDERGTARPAAGPIDLGAVQVSVASPTPTPVAVTGAATSVTSSRATLSGTVNPQGLAASSYFEYGPNVNYGSKSSTGQLAAGTTAVPAGAKLSNLKANTTYHYRLVASNVNGQSNGKDGTFKTAKPSIRGLRVTTRPNHARKFPYRFKFTGKVRLPHGITNGAACGGKVSVRIKHGKHTVFKGRTSVFATCAWKLSVKLSKRKAVRGHGKLSVTVSFTGNNVLAPFANKPYTIRYG